MMHDIQMLVARLVEKASQLLGNFTTNLAESWMHIRSKFYGGKVINRSQSGSWQYRCMRAGLQQNLGKTWGPKTWSEMTSTNTNQVFVDISNSASKIAKNDKQHKATERNREEKANNIIQEKKIHNRHSRRIIDMIMEAARIT